ncbi:hypothetical protein QTP88_008736 [Uroleucon formosanum]
MVFKYEVTPPLVTFKKYNHSNPSAFALLQNPPVIKKDDFPLTNNVDTQEQNDQLVDDPDSCSTKTETIQVQDRPSDKPFSHTSSSTFTNSLDTDLGDMDSGPMRPMLKVYPKTKFGTQNRSFTSVYYTRFDWLEYSVKMNAVFCFACRIFSNDYGNSENTFTITGFSNWKKISFKLKCHESTKTHLNSLTRMAEYENSKINGSIISKMSSFHQQQIIKNRNYLLHLIDIALYLGKQGIAFRGHDKSSDSNNQGNFKELCKLVSKHDPDFEHSYLQNINLSSWKVQEELIKMCADQVKEIILNQIVNVGLFAIMCDEARCYREEQLSICVRYVVDLQVYERFIGFVNVSSGQDANNILAAITDFFKTQTIDISTLKIIAQSYDGASVMSGRLNGVQAKIKELYPSAIYTHCMAHRLNLVVVDMCKNIKSARNVFNILEAVFVHFSRPSNHLKLSEIQICDTRWVCRYKNCEAMLNNYTAIILNYEVEEQSDKDVVQAMVVLTILKEVLSIINVLSNTLQNKCATLGMSKNVIISVITTFENLRSDDEFSNVWRKIMHTAEKIGICLQNPSKGSKRQRREPKTLHDYVLTTTTGAEEIEESTSVETFWKTTAYMCIMDTVINNLKYRFSDESLLMANSVDSFCNLDYTNSLYFIDHYKDIVNISIDSLRSEMVVAHNCLKVSKNDFDFNDLKKVVEKHIYPNLYKMLQIAVTIPISSATCERSFSSMRHIKNWLRSSMGQERFGNLSILCIERDIANIIDTQVIVDKFSKKDRRITLI